MSLNPNLFAYRDLERLANEAGSFEPLDTQYTVTVTGPTPSFHSYCWIRPVDACTLQIGSSNIQLHAPSGRGLFILAYDYIFRVKGWNPVYILWGEFDQFTATTILKLLNDTKSIGMISPGWGSSSSHDPYIACLCNHIYRSRLKLPYQTSPNDTFNKMVVRREVMHAAFKYLPPQIYYLIHNDLRLTQIVQRWVVEINRNLFFRHQTLATQPTPSPLPYVAIMAAHITSMGILQLTHNNIHHINQLGVPFAGPHVVVYSLDPKSSVTQQDVELSFSFTSFPVVLILVNNHPVTRDFDKWRHGYTWWRNNSTNRNTQFILHNDSYILTRPPYEMVLQHEPSHVTGIILSHQMHDHVQSYLRILPDSVMPELCEHVRAFKGKTVQDLICAFEVYYFNPACLSFVYQAQFPATNPTNDDCELHGLITHRDFPIIKRKAIYQGNTQKIRPYLVPHIPAFFLRSLQAEASTSTSTKKTKTKKTKKTKTKKQHGAKPSSPSVSVWKMDVRSQRVP